MSDPLRILGFAGSLRAGSYNRALLKTAQGLAPDWQPGSAPRVLGYLRPFKLLEQVLEALKRSKVQVLLRVGDIPVSKLRGFERPGMRIVEQAVDMRAAARSCDAFINYGSHGVTAEMLLAGKPGILLANNLERELVAARAVQLGCLAPLATGDFNLSEGLRRVCEDPALRKPAQEFAARYSKQDRKATVNTSDALKS